MTDIRDFLRTKVFDRTLPSLSSADLMGTKLMLYYEEPLDTTSNPASSHFTATPEPGVALSGAGCEYRLGWKLGLVSGRPLSLEYGVEATRTEYANDSGPGPGTGSGPTSTPGVDGGHGHGINLVAGRIRRTCAQSTGM